MDYYKLIRDKIPEIIKQNGSMPVIHVAADEEYQQKLKDKLKEEVDEFLTDESEEELADIIEVVYAICDFKNINRDRLESLRMDKAKKRGGFKKKIILEKVK